jgi:CRP-like cAMP-binding protein
MLSTPVKYLASTELSSDSYALMWDRRTIRELVSSYPILLDNALSIAATENVAWLISKQVSLSCDDARGRIAHLLVSLACGIGEATSGGLKVLVTNEHLAMGASVTPFTVSRTLSDWQRAGVLSKGRGSIILRRLELLAAAS